MFWYPNDSGYVNLENALSIDIEQIGTKFSLVAKFSTDGKSKITLKVFDTREEAAQLLDWIVKELNKK